jgi:hypothetical protein
VVGFGASGAARCRHGGQYAFRDLPIRLGDLSRYSLRLGRALGMRRSLWIITLQSAICLA